MSSTGDQNRAERVLIRSILHQNVIVEDFREIYDLAIKLKNDFSHVLKIDLTQFLADLTAEQDAGRNEEYLIKHAPLSREVKR